MNIQAKNDKSVIHLAGGTEEEQKNLLDKLLDPQHFFTPKILAAIQGKAKLVPVKEEVSKRLACLA